MYEKLRGVVLRTVKYNDKYSVVRVYTDGYGLLSFLLPQNGGKVSRVRRALFQPLSLVEIESNILPNRDIYRLSETRCMVPLMDLYSNPIKNSIALFITDLLSQVIVEREQNAPLFSFLFSSIQLLDELDDGYANFHICFLYHLGVFIGIEPDVSTYRPNYYFDMLNGVFSGTRPIHPHFVEGEEARALMLLSRMTFANMHHFRFNRMQRKRLLKLTVDYYALHHSSLGELKSLEVLSELFE